MSEEWTPITDDGGLELLGALPAEPLQPHRYSKIRVAIKVETFEGELTESHRHFFAAGVRALKPGNFDNNLPKAVLHALPFISATGAHIFRASADYQSNDFIVNYPVHTAPVRMTLEVLELTEKRVVDTKDLLSYLRSAELLKDQANKLFAQGLISPASKSYTRAVNLLQGAPAVLKPREDPQVRHLLLCLHNNCSLAALKLGKFEQARLSAQSALEIEGESCKAHYRIAQALFYLHRFDEAEAHFERAQVDCSTKLRAGKVTAQSEEKRIYRRFGRALWVACSAEN